MCKTYDEEYYQDKQIKEEFDAFYDEYPFIDEEEYDNVNWNYSDEDYYYWGYE